MGFSSLMAKRSLVSYGICSNKISILTAFYLENRLTNGLSRSEDAANTCKSLGVLAIR